MATGTGTVEVEIKARVRDRAALEAELEARGAELEATHLQEDTYFAHPVRAFARTDEAFRLRVSDEGGWLTYKGPKLDEETKTRREIDVPVGDPVAAADLVEALGFEPVASVRKERDVFGLGELEVVLDEVDGVGSYCEIERLSAPDEVDERRQEVLELARELGLGELERRSYLELLLERESGGERGEGGPGG